ncbi:peptidylprolyl isomerase [Catellatospora tritici]|uniref:peptidylprolyl isomerase n=1 Tax=Catellatospora tritici TaxID=2851566 RepID=UPI001C2D862C|nr:peptidylprolyl isomerase [Catellatospora tritici]MBV1850363.1 peptidylprolyl isomerase [Catellatospora tritici]
MATPPWTPEPNQFTAPTPQRRGTRVWVIVVVVSAIVALLLCLVGAAVVLLLRVGDAVDEAAGPQAPRAPLGQSAPAAPAGTALCKWQPSSVPGYDREVGTPSTTVPARGSQTMTIKTNRGVITIAIDTAKAPCTAASMSYLASHGFFAGSSCHRLTTRGISVLQCGDPTGTGMGGPTYKYADENLPNVTDPTKAYPVGTVAMADTGMPESTGSQFFIVWGPSELAQDYTVLGRVTAGMDLVTAVGRAGAVRDGKAAEDGTPKLPVLINTITITDPA